MATLSPDISVVVPCLGEEINIAALLRLLDTAAAQFTGTVDVVVVDGGADPAIAGVVEQHASARYFCCTPSRAGQMNLGAAQAQGGILYFVHADTRPPLSCFVDVAAAVAQGESLGGYAFEFDSTKPLLRFNSWLTTFNVLSTRGGDQTLFLTRELFAQLGGFRESMVIMEEYDLFKRARDLGVRNVLLQGQTLVSARKYERHSWVRVQLANIRAMAMWRMGYDAQAIRERYCHTLRAGINDLP